MKASNLLLCPLMAALFLCSCSSTKNIALDPISVHGARKNADIYQASYTRVTDILHTSLDLKLDWDSAYVIGKATIEAKPYLNPLSEVVLDAKGFRINQVSLVDGFDSKPLKYTYNNKQLSIDLGRTFTDKQKFKILVDYVAMPDKLKVGTDIGDPASRGFYFINRDNAEPGKPRQFWTQGETQNNSCWFPTIDDPQEKMTQEISITLPTGMVSLSNGLLDFSTDNGDGTHTDSWRQEQPHSTYLTMLAGGDFKIVKDTWREKEVSYYMEPKYADNAQLIFGKTPEMIEFFSTKLKVDYPWEKYAQIVLRDFSGGAMENTTATTFFEGMNMTPAEYLDESHEDIISHELFHHWFGDLVTSESWSNLPLNESFATYGEYLWNEYKYGRDEADYKGWNDANAYFNDDRAKEADVIRFNYPDREQMFDVVSYQKGGRILHMLRKTVGDEAFFETLNLYLKRHSFATAEIHDLRLAFEEVTGRDLNWFFNQWFLAAGNPVLDINTQYDATTKKSLVTVKQTQSLSNAPLYRLPVAIDFYINGKAERKQVIVDQAEQSFSFDMPQQPDLVNFDAEKYLLCVKKENKTAAQYVIQYQQAPLFVDRIEAIQALAKQPGDKQSAATIISALQDKHWVIRRLAVKTIGSLSKEAQASAHAKLKELALNDPRSYVRASAISALRKVYKADRNDETLSKAQQDQSPTVLKALSE
ncbi:MAG: M1 family aminopeptidase [Arcticibacter sp.]